MIKNDFLLRILLFAGCFLLAEVYGELFGLLIGLGFKISYWVGIVIGALVAYKVQDIVVPKIQNSIVKRGELTTTLRWGLYIFSMITIFVLCMKFVDNVIYTPPRGVKNMIFTGSIGEVIKALGLFFLVLITTFYTSITLVRKIGFVHPLNTSPTIQTPSTNNSIRKKNDKQTIHGSSAFLDYKEFNQKYNGLSDREMASQFENHGGFVVMPGAMRYIDLVHMLTIAGSGQGKGTSAIIPNLLTKPQESWIVLDVKGENAAVTARFQKESGQKVYIIDPFEVQKHIEARHHIPSSGFNPLTIAKYLPEQEVTDFASMIAEMFIPEGSGKSSGSDNFWIDSGRNLIKSYILHLLTNERITNKNLGVLYEWLRLDNQGQAELWIDMSYNEKTKYASNEIQSLAINGDKTWLGILSEARRATSFLESPLIRKSLESDTFDPMILQRSNATVYVILPERNLNTHKTWLRLVFGTTLKLCNFIAKRRVNFLMDEFPILGRMDDFVRASAFGRGQKISVWFFAQSLSQLKDIYGEDGLNTLLTNAKLKQFFGMNDLYTQKYVSELLGMTTEITSTYNRV